VAEVAGLEEPDIVDPVPIQDSNWLRSGILRLAVGDALVVQHKFVVIAELVSLQAHNAMRPVMTMARREFGGRS
jgi:hypothetical protein